MHDGAQVCRRRVSHVLVGLLSVVPRALPHPPQLDTSVSSDLNTGGLGGCNGLLHTLK